MKRAAKKRAARKAKHLTTAELKKLYAGLAMADEAIERMCDKPEMLQAGVFPNWIGKRR